MSNSETLAKLRADAMHAWASHAADTAARAHKGAKCEAAHAAAYAAAQAHADIRIVKATYKRTIKGA